MASNIWHANLRKKMLKTHNAESHRDGSRPRCSLQRSDHMQAWTDEKDRSKVLTPKQTLDAYKQTLKLKL
jgi:hypothetical protein